MAVSTLGDYYPRQFNEGNREAIQFLVLEEADAQQLLDAIGQDLAQLPQ